jgi:hypothetical protein
MIKNFIKKITGIKAIEDATAQANAEAAVAQKLAEQKLKEAADAEAKAELAKLTPKERATRKGEPWVSVLDTHVNKDNVRNGFFELDWNDAFVVQLKQEGYGYDGDPDEEIVDRWFRDLARNILSDEGQDASRGAGYINVSKLADGKAEVK